MFRFSIRDVLWLTVVVAALLAWSLDRRHTRYENALALDAKSKAIEVAAKKEKFLRQEVDILGQLVRTHEVELSRRDAVGAVFIPREGVVEPDNARLREQIATYQKLVATYEAELAQIKAVLRESK